MLEGDVLREIAQGVFNHERSLAQESLSKDPVTDLLLDHENSETSTKSNGCS